MTNKSFSRRDWLLAGAATAALAIAGKNGQAQLSSSLVRPNIVWLVSEDNNPLIGAYGDSLAHTPTIDALAASGVLYANAFSNAPVCAPSRFGIITGMYPESCAPAQHMRAMASVPAFLQGFPKYLREAGYYCSNNAKQDYNAKLDVEAMWDESSNKAHWRNRPAGAPFFAVFNFNKTHESQLFKVTEGRVRPADVRVPAYLPDVPAVRSDIASYYNLMERMDAELAACLAEIEAAGLADNTIVFYYSDNGGVLPRSKRYCYDEGLRTALVVRTPARWSHLAPAEPGSRITAPVSFIDLAPTMLALASLKIPKYMQGTPLIDARAGGRAVARQYAFGMRNRMDERYDMMRTVCDERYRYIRNYSPHRIYGQYQAFEWQLASYKAWETKHIEGRLNPVQERFWQEKPAEEFYDLEADRDQILNLIHAPEHRQRIGSMRAALDAHMLEINDNGFIPEGSVLEGYDQTHMPGAYPLKRIMQLADQAIRCDSRNAKQFIALLDDGHEVIRYWAAQGLLMLKAEAAPARPALESCLMRDRSPHVRVVAAEALTWLTNGEASVQYLTGVLDSPANVWLRLQALDALTWIGAPARSALPVIERIAHTDKDVYIGRAAGYLSLILKGSYTPSAVVFKGVGG